MNGKIDVLSVLESDARWADDCRVSHEGLESCSNESDYARNAVAELVAAAVNARYSLAWHKKQGHFVGMDGKFLDDLDAALARFGGGK
jgi:hypothetical protein